MSTDDKGAILSAQKAWFVALNAMLAGDPAPFADIYSHSEDVSYMSAEGGLRVGWESTWRDWQAQARLARGGNMEEVENHISIHGDVAVVQFIEKGMINNPKGEGVEQVARETSVYRRENGIWKMMAHHADAIPGWIDVAGDANSA